MQSKLKSNCEGGIESTPSKFHRTLFVIKFHNSNLTYEFHVQIYSHYSKNRKPEMTIDRFHMVATTNVHFDLKGKWLQWWNASNEVRRSFRFPEQRPIKDRNLVAFLHRASLWAQVT